MKKIIFVLIVICLFISLANSQIQMTSNGDIGIGINPQGNQKMSVLGGIYSICKSQTI